MNEKEMIAFIDGLDRTGQRRSESEGKDEATAQLSELWDELGELDEARSEKPEIVSKFRNSLDAYQSGWAAASASSERTSISEGKNRNGGLASFARYGLVAGLAAVLTLTGYLAVSQSLRTIELEAQLASTQETLALALLEQPSAPKRLAGLAAAAQVRDPSQRLRNTMVKTFDSDANLNVRLAAVEALRALPREEALSVLLDRMEKEASPLVQLEILRQVMQLVEKGSEGEVIERIEALPLEPRVRAFVEAGSQRI